MAWETFTCTEHPKPRYFISAEKLAEHRQAEHTGEAPASAPIVLPAIQGPRLFGGETGHVYFFDLKAQFEDRPERPRPTLKRKGRVDGARIQEICRSFLGQRNVYRILRGMADIGAIGYTPDPGGDARKDSFFYVEICGKEYREMDGREMICVGKPHQQGRHRWRAQPPEDL